jgi:hypothetical protein
VRRGYVRHSLSNVWAEYDRVKLLESLGNANDMMPRPQIQIVSQ